MAKKLGIKIYYDENSGEIIEIKRSRRMEQEGVLFQIKLMEESINVLQLIHDYELQEYDKITKIARA